MSPAAIKELETVAASTVAIYLFLVVALRLFGRHSLAQLSSIDLLILMLLGSSVETSMVHGSSLLRYGFLATLVLLALNRTMTYCSQKSPTLNKLLGGGPMILVNHGKFVTEHLARAGLTQSDVMEALRKREYGDLAQIRLAVLEPDGDINVIAEPGEGSEAGDSN